MSRPTSAEETGRAAVILYSYYEIDPRPRRASEALARAGFQVDVICLRRDSSTPKRETINAVNVYRVSLRHRRGGKLFYALQYLYFLVRAFFRLSAWSLKKRYSVVHVHNMPDFLVFSALLPRLLGARVILDLHDPMPELFAALFDASPESFALRFLKRMEKWSMGFADLVLTPNQAFKELFVSRGCPAEKIEIVMNSPQTDIFHERKVNVPPAVVCGARPFRLMYHGLLVERHGLDLAIATVAALRLRIPQIELHIYGAQTDFVKASLRLVRLWNLEEMVFYHGFKSLPEIADAIAPIDLGVVPNRLNPFTRINLPTRIFEYLAMGKAVIAPRTKGIQDYFKEDELLFFEPGNVDDLARGIEWVYHNPCETRSMVARGRKVYERHTWDFEQDRFTGLVEGLIGTRGRAVLPINRLAAR